MAVATLSKHVPIAGERRTQYGTLRVTPISPHIGAEVEGVDLSGPLSAEQLRDIRAAWADWMVLVFRDQHLDREAHKAFGRHFGRLHVHPMNHGRPGQDSEVLVVKTNAQSAYTAGEGWHTDVTCDEIPPLGSMLYITETPECGGGDTLFADMYMAYEMLSPPMKAFLEGLTAVHDGALPYIGNYQSKPPEGGYPRHEHPVVIRHPDTGRKVLNVNSGFTTHIVGLQRWESRALLDSLFALLPREPKLHCRVRWEPNTLTFWDNRCTQHHSVWDYFPHSRYGERVSIVGERAPSAASAG
ncbi:MAG: TauD/TfdA family dioxygenase [Phenylobacterium sp.]|uniref:TauD/TfdA dioxygenase family protein n=1 Tax=Phenylobacterium sp. TaxID=1871053 RepID=UPI002718A971|nr:TauD/TfdA family dioxygenase [Phenylobacterium sp.]MDO9248215.1 TauD/TfdA family dioxygenase [Phenylobacterium sp.]MDP2009091.1 TauD/TfdA family dioxygenase [Phenylobacterium sp.]MDP3867030.1 TauD/TfdA family dioxygenase [Phenylobacterium sp.]